MKEKIKYKIKDLKYYFSIVFDFLKLNKYIFLSSKLINRLNIILSSDLDDNVKLDNIKIVYSDFKIDYDFNEFNENIKVKNKFER